MTWGGEGGGGGVCGEVVGGDAEMSIVGWLEGRSAAMDVSGTMALVIFAPVRAQLAPPCELAVMVTPEVARLAPPCGSAVTVVVVGIVALVVCTLAMARLVPRPCVLAILLAPVVTRLAPPCLWTGVRWPRISFHVTVSVWVG